jgi:5-methylcytosine-specific restriction endonuclease McrA
MTADRRQQLRGLLFCQQKGRCFYCRRHMVAAEADDDRAVTLDEIVPQSKGGRAHPSNAVAACRRCNKLKADKPVKEFLRKERPGKPIAKRKLSPKDAEIARARATRKMLARRALTSRITA